MPPASTKNKPHTNELIVTTEDEEVKNERETALVNKSANKLLQIIKTPTRENRDIRSPVQYKDIMQGG